MKNTIIPMLLVQVLFFTFQNPIEAQIKISHGVISNGGGVTSNGQMQIIGTIGQPMVGNSNNGSNNNCHKKINRIETPIDQTQADWNSKNCVKV